MTICEIVANTLTTSNDFFHTFVYTYTYYTIWTTFTFLSPILQNGIYIYSLRDKMTDLVNTAAGDRNE